MAYSHKHMNTQLQSPHMLLIFQHKNQVKLWMFAAAPALPAKSPNVKVKIPLFLFYKLCEKYSTLLSRFQKTKSVHRVLLYLRAFFFFFFPFFTNAWSVCQYLFKAWWTESLTLFRILVTLSQFKVTLLIGPVAAAAPCLQEPHQPHQHMLSFRL